MRYLVGCILFLQSFVILAQSSQNKRIDYQEKQRLENEFKVLGDYYIDDSGLVVYKTDSNIETRDNNKKEDSNSNEEPVNTGKPTKEKEYYIDDSGLAIYKESSSNNDKETNSTRNRESVNTTDKPTQEKKQSNIIQEERRLQQSDDRANALKATPSKANNLNTERKQSTKTTPIIVDRTSSKENNNSTTNVPKPVVTNIDKTVSETSTTSNGSIFNRKRQPQYKNMEEAALAVEALIADLKKEQTVNTNSSSMSSRLSRGVTKDLRKQSGRNIQQVYPSDNSTYMIKNVEEANDFGNEPSYFINGVQVEKVEINKLRSADIINREIRVKNTATGNPNGEIWYEVRDASH